MSVLVGILLIIWLVGFIICLLDQWDNLELKSTLAENHQRGVVLAISCVTVAAIWPIWIWRK